MPDRKAGDRLFLAVALTPDARQNLARLLPPELPGRIVASYNWHFTLQFLGATAADQRERLIGELDGEAFGEAFHISLVGLGAFPHAARARVLWIGVEEGAPQLSALAHRARNACVRAGLAVEGRPYSPHLTLSRLDPPRDVRRILATPAARPVIMPVTELLLLRSLLGSGPPVYEALRRYRLTA